MKMILCDGRLVETDYWEAADGCQAGRPWVSADGEVWHLLMPCPPVQAPKSALSMPVTAWSEPEQWVWKLWLSSDFSLRLPRAAFCGRAPGLPERGWSAYRALQCYGLLLPGITDQVTWGFGQFSEQEGMVPLLWTTRLRLMRAQRR